MGFLDFKNRCWHEKIIKKLDGFYFYGKNIKITLNPKPPRHSFHNDQIDHSGKIRKEQANHCELGDLIDLRSPTSSISTQTIEQESDIERKSLNKLNDDYLLRIGAMSKRIKELEEELKKKEKKLEERENEIEERERQMSAERERQRKMDSSS